MLRVPLLLVACVCSFALPVLGATLDFEDRPVWDSVQLCDIPNEVKPGECKLPAECAAYSKINDVENLGSVERFSFIKQVQCNVSDVEPYVCCPRSSDAYLAPYINDTVEEEIVHLSGRIDDDTCGIQAFGGRIHGGQLAELNEFPWTAMLLYQYGRGEPEQGCGGALISRTFVITAAHCITGKYWEQAKGRLTYVRLQEYNIYSDPDCIIELDGRNCADKKIDFPPQDIILHPEYQPASLHQQHDVALIRIEQTPPFNNYIRAICLPELCESSEAKGKKFSVSGWGRTNQFINILGPDIPSPIKLKIKLPYVEQEQCNEAFQPWLISLGAGQMCAGGEEGKDACRGDSGSPLMDFDTTRGAWYIKGIVSFGGKTCGLRGLPGVYTNVQHYMPWIKSHTAL